MPLPVFTISRPVPRPKWRFGVAQKDLCRLQTLHEVIQRLIQGVLMDVDLCQPPCPTTVPVRDNYLDVSGAKLSRSSLLHRVG
jgi:hypothetical protein